MSIIHDALKKIEKERVRETTVPPHLHSNLTTLQEAPVQPRGGWKGSLSLRIPNLSFKKNLLGVDIGSTSIKIVSLEIKGESCRIKAFGYIKIPSGTAENRIIEALRGLVRLRGFEKSRVASSIDVKSLTFGHINLPKMPKEDLTEAVRWEVKKNIDFPDEAIIDYLVSDEVIEDGKPKLSVMTFAVRKDEVLSHVETLKAASLIPDAIDVGPMALLSAFDYNYGGEKGKRYAVIDIGASKTTLAIISNGSLRFARYIPLAGNDITRTIQDAGKTDFQAAEDMKVSFASVLNDAPEMVRAAVKSFTEGISIEIRRSFTYYQAHFREGGVDGIFLSGGCANIKGLAADIENSVGAATSVYDSIRGVEVKSDTNRDMTLDDLAPSLAEAFGLALRRAGE